MTFCLGKLDAVRPAGLMTLAEYGSLPAPPPHVDFTRLVKSFPMYGNDVLGDCTIAGTAHMDQAWNAISGLKGREPTLKAVEAEYYKLGDGKDEGLVEADVLKAWQTSGMFGSKIVAYAPVSTRDETVMQSCVNTFGGLYIGIQVPENAQTQFAQGQPWTLVSGWRKIAIEGGHAIPILGYNSEYLIVVTWGKVQLMSWEWWATYGDEAWAIIPHQYSVDKVPATLPITQLLADLKLV